MPRERTIKKFTRVAQEMEYELIFYPQTTLTLETIRARVNSYCGIMSHYKSFELQRKYFYVPAYTHYFEFHNYMQKCDIKPEFCLEF